ncbi:MAG: four-carbon acid sugar kinase family protein [Planctomycetaceae bacterium]|nr:four-carbon acid sugar kinase family protein [Planctomycetaceae bacterium]
MSSVIVIADDLSGAAELAGIAFARGYSAEVQREFDPTSDAEAIAVDPDSRGLPPTLAAQRVEQVARAVAAARSAWIYKKVDSVLRGNVRVEIEAVLRATGRSRALLVPANPSRGRTIADSRLLIDGVPLDQTPFRDDPEHPRTSAVISELLGQSDLIDVPDVADSWQLHRFAVQLDKDVLPAGAADFFAALLDTHGAGQGSGARPAIPPLVGRPALLVCGSRAAWTARKGACQAQRIPILALPEATADLTSVVQGAAAELVSRGVLAIAIDPASSRPSQVQQQLPRLASVAAMLLEATPVATTLAEGGATAAAIAECRGWTRFRVVQTAPAGVGVLQPLDRAGTPTFLIKPGSYAWPDEIWRQLQNR